MKFIANSTRTTYLNMEKIEAFHIVERNEDALEADSSPFGLFAVVEGQRYFVKGFDNKEAVELYLRNL